MCNVAAPLWCNDVCERLLCSAFAVAHLRMTVPCGGACPPQRDVVQNRHVVANHRRLPDDDASGMVKQDSMTNPCRRVYVNVENLFDVEDKQSDVAYSWQHGAGLD